MPKKHPPELPKPLEELKGVKCWGLFTLNPSNSEKKYTVHCKSNDARTLDTLHNVWELKKDNQVIVLSITEANKYLLKEYDKKLNVFDADWYGKYEQNFDRELFNDFAKATYTEYSPSKKGAHVFLALSKGKVFIPFETNPTGLDLKTSGFITMTFELYPGSPDHIRVDVNVIDSSEKASGRFKLEDWEPMDPFNKDGSLSPIWCFNMQTDPTVLLDDHPDYERYGSRYLYIPSSSKNPGVMVYQGMKGDWDGVVSYHDDKLPNKFLDPWGVHQAFKGKDYLDKDSLRNLSRTVKAIDPDTGEMLDLTVDEFNKRPKHYIPTELIFPDDKWGKYVRAIMDATMYRANPVASLASALSYMAYIAGGVYTTKDYDATDIANLQIGNSKVGKSQTMQGASRLMPENALANIHKRMSRSEEGIQDAYIDCGLKPDILYVVDEIGFLFKDMKKANGGGDRWQSMLELLVRGHQIYFTRSGAGKAGTMVQYPFFGLLGSTTIEALKGGLTKQDILIGAVNRLNLWDVTQDVKTKRKGEHSLDSHVMKRLKDIYDGVEMISDRKKGIPVLVDDDVAELMYKQGGDMTTSNTEARHEQAAFTLAFIRAIYNGTSVTLDYYKWGYDLIGKSLLFIKHLFNFHFTDKEPPHITAEKKLIEKLKDNGDELEWRVATNQYHLKRIGSVAKNALLTAMMSGEDPVIKKESRKQPSGKNKTFMVLLK